MFANSTVNAATLDYFRNRTQLALACNKIDPEFQPVIELFAERAGLQSAWCCQGHVRVENGKRRTRLPHNITFVVTPEGYSDLETIYRLWQESPMGELMTVTLMRLKYPQNEREGLYPAWRFQLTARPEPDVIQSAIQTWVRIAQAL